MPLKKTPILIILVFLFGIMLINLAHLPIAWVDEIMNMDPAWNFLQYGRFVGTTWPHPGSESNFLAYLPLTSFIHLFSLKLLPVGLFYQRLPWFIMLIGTCIFLYHYTVKRYMSLPAGVLLLLCFFVVDEGISNALRSVRVELPSMLLAVSGIYLSFRNRYPTLQSFIIGCMLLTHPYMYPVAIVLGIYLMTRKATFLKKLRYAGTILLFPLIYLVMANFDFQNIMQQLIAHGQEHDAAATGGNLFWQHFVERFYPIYRWQFYMMPLFLAFHAYALYSIIFRWNPASQQVEWIFLAMSIFWFFSLAPFNRYTSVLSLFMYMMLPGLLHRILSVLGFMRLSFRRITRLHALILFLILAFVSAPFFLRNSVAMLQWSQRDAQKVYTWLDQNIEDESNAKVLIVDEAIGFYYMRQHAQQIDFTLPYAVHKYQFDDYEKVYYLSFREAPVNAKKISELAIEGKDIDIPYKPSILTYNGLCLYEILNEEGMKEIKR